MTAQQTCKNYGTTLEEFSSICEVPQDELLRWYEHKPNLFICVLEASVQKKNEHSSLDDIRVAIDILTK